MAGIDILASAFSGANAAFLADLYARWASNPASVDPSFADLFAAMNDEARAVLEDASGASWAPRPSFSDDEVAAGGAKPVPGGLGARAGPRRHHHVAAGADADPLLPGARSPRSQARPARADHSGHNTRSWIRASYGFTEADMDKPIFIDNVLGRETATLREIMQILRQTYCGPIGVEFMHIQDPEQKSWIQRRVEGAPWLTLPRRRRKAHHPAATDRSRRVRGVLPEALCHHQALRPGRRRGHHPGAARDDRDGGGRTAWSKSPSACLIAAG